MNEIEFRPVDYDFSKALLAHVRSFQLLDTQKEIMPVLCPEGICSHRVDMRDHLGVGLNNQRFY